VELEELDALQAEQRQALFGLSFEIGGLAIGLPSPRSGPHEARFGRDDEIVWVGMQRLSDQSFAHLGPVRIGGVDERDPQLDCPSQHSEDFVVVTRLTPHAPPGDLHGAIPQPDDRQIAADRELSAGTGGFARELRHDDPAARGSKSTCGVEIMGPGRLRG
jgi:hypothetical protein